MEEKEYSYWKFNNSKSAKAPFFVYLRAGQEGVEDATGGLWTGVISGSIRVSKEEWDAVRASSDETRDVQAGDDVVVLEYLPLKKRYSKVRRRYTWTGTGPTHERVELENGDDWSLREVRKSTFIHKT
jgi:hypothetical protein